MKNRERNRKPSLPEPETDDVMRQLGKIRMIGSVQLECRQSCFLRLGMLPHQDVHGKEVVRHRAATLAPAASSDVERSFQSAERIGKRALLDVEIPKRVERQAVDFDVAGPDSHALGAAQPKLGPSHLSEVAEHPSGGPREPRVRGGGERGGFGEQERRHLQADLERPVADGETRVGDAPSGIRVRPRQLKREVCERSLRFRPDAGLRQFRGPHAERGRIRECVPAPSAGSAAPRVHKPKRAHQVQCVLLAGLGQDPCAFDIRAGDLQR